MSLRPALYKSIRKALLASGYCDNVTSLRTIFAIDARLSPWRNRIQAQNTPEEQVDALIADLCNQSAATGENALALFLYVLSEHIEPGNALHAKMTTLALDLDIEITQDLIKEKEALIGQGTMNTQAAERRKQELLQLRKRLKEYQGNYATLTGQDRSKPALEANSFPEDWLARLPQPLAAAGAAYGEAADDTARFLALDVLIRVAVKFLAAAALAQYRKDSPDTPQLRPWLLRLSRHHLSEWAALLDEITAYYAAQAEPPRVIAVLLDAYNRPLMKNTALERLYGELSERLQADPAQRPALRDFIQCLVAYRERTWEGGLAYLPSDFAPGLLPLLPPALREWLDGCAILHDYPLRYLETAREGEDGWHCEMADWLGPDTQPVRTTCTLARAHKARRLYLCAPNRLPLVNLHPLFIHYLDTLYFLEAWGEDETLTFRPCLGGASFPAPQSLRKSLHTIFDESPDAFDLEAIEEQVEQMALGKESESPPPPPPNPLPLPDLLARLSDDAHQALEIALGESLRIGRFWLGVEFLLMGLSKQDGQAFSDLLHELGLSRGHFRGALRSMVGVATEADWRKVDVAELGAQVLDALRPADPETLAADFVADEDHPPVVTPRLMQVLRDAAEMAGEAQIEHGHLLLAALMHPHAIPINLLLGQALQAGWQPDELMAWVADRAGVDLGDLAQILDLDGAAPGAQRPGRRRPGHAGLRRAHRGQGLLAEVGRDLTALAQKGELHAAIGEAAHKAMVQMGLILQQTRANNPILLGDAGVGKTAIVEGFAYRLATDAGVVAHLADKRIVDLPPASLLAGTKYRGDLEQRLQDLLHEVREAGGHVIIFIDEIHTILGGGAEGGLSAIANALKPALARGEFPCIGATTVGEYRRYIEADPALARRFTPVWIEEPSVEDAIEIAGAVAREHLGPSHGVRYPQAVIEEAVRLAVRYLHDERLPGKAVKLLDQAGPHVLMGGSLSGRPHPQPLSPAAGPTPSRHLRPRHVPPAAERGADLPPGGGIEGGPLVTLETIRAIVSERTGIPLTRLEEKETQKLLDLEARLQAPVKGQDEAVSEVTRVVKRARAGLADPHRPTGVFLFAGPTGVGKTELALALAEALFDDEDAILRLDMSEYMEKHQISRLIGSPPGYVGYEQEGQLIGRLRRRPYSVVLLDEIEKAHPDVQHLFLQLFDAGRLTDARGNLADGRNAIFIMTTNLGAKDAMGFIGQQKPYRERLHEAIVAHFTPEFLNRIDRIVYFNPLTSELLVEIFDKLFAPVAERFRAQGIAVEVDEAFKRALCERYASDKRGARPLARGIEDAIVAPLTDALLAGRIGAGNKVIMEKDRIVVEEQPPAAASQPALLGAADQPQAPVGKQAADPRSAVQALLDALTQQLAEQDITLEMDDKAWELLCEALGEDLRAGLDPATAFVQWVQEPLLEQVQAGEFQAGDHVQISRAFTGNWEICFIKLEGN